MDRFIGRKSASVARALPGRGSALFVLLSVLLALVALAPGCKRSPGGAASTDGAGGATPVKRVVTTTAHLADLVRTIAGRRLGIVFGVESILGEGSDPHTATLTASDRAKMLGADLVIFNGLHLEGKMDEMVPALREAGVRVAIAGEYVPPTLVLRPEGSAGQPDPHCWMNPRIWSQVGLRLQKELAAIDPEGDADQRVALKSHMEELSMLADYCQQVLGSIPPGARVLVTSHDAFGYLGKEFGLEVLGVQGISTESEAGVADTQRLIDRVVASKIPAVFIESSVSEATIRAIVRGAAAQGHTVVVGGQLYSDALGKPGTWEGTYLGMMDHNVSTIARALGGTVPAGGFKKYYLENRP